MDDREKIVSALMAANPQSGGVSATNRPSPYGLRAYPDGKGGYGGQMMPKTDGWLGQQKMPNGNIMTEFSSGDERGDFPTLVPNTPPNELQNLLNQNLTQEQLIRAREFANARRALGLSPFLDAEEMK
ncbi:MAG: hypothetical protein ABL868_08145 [Sulfuriferula sp.]